METVVIVIHLMVIVAMVALVLLQRSEGGALGIGGGGGFMSSRGQGNILTRSTAVLAAAFFATSIVLSVLAQWNAPPSAILDAVPATTPTPAGGGDTTTPGSGQGRRHVEPHAEPDTRHPERQHLGSGRAVGPGRAASPDLAIDHGNRASPFGSHQNAPEASAVGALF